MRKALRIFTVLCIVSITLTAFAANAYAAEASMANFKISGSYKPGQFYDISENEWFGYNKQRVVSKAYDLGLMQGKGERFDPNAGVTLAEAITIAARINNIYSGGEWVFHESSPWYYSYLEYMVHKDIVQFETFKDLTKPATRAEMAYIFSCALPEGEFAIINTIDTLPDVKDDTEYKSSVFMLYRAGILTGNDAYGTFGPNDSITRAQAAAIITRIALPSERVEFSLTPEKKEEPVENEEPTSTIPVWKDVYSQGMIVKTKDELYKLIDAAFKNLIPQFDITLENAVYDVYRDDIDFQVKYANSGVTHSNYDYQTKEFSLRIEYSMFHQMQGIIFNREAVEQYASAQIKEYDDQMRSILAKIITPGMSEKEKVKAVHDYMVVNYKYDISADDVNVDAGLYGKDSYSVQGLLKNGTGVCQAYAELFYLFMCYTDIECYYVTGFAKGEGDEYGLHAWNVVYADDGYYHVDVTFDDPVPDAGSKISYDYFLKTDEQMEKDHMW